MEVLLQEILREVSVPNSSRANLLHPSTATSLVNSRLDRILTLCQQEIWVNMHHQGGNHTVKKHRNMTSMETKVDK